TYDPRFRFPSSLGRTTHGHMLYRPLRFLVFARQISADKCGQATKNCRILLSAVHFAANHADRDRSANQFFVLVRPSSDRKAQTIAKVLPSYLLEMPNGYYPVKSTHTNNGRCRLKSALLQSLRRCQLRLSAAWD